MLSSTYTYKICSLSSSVLSIKSTGATTCVSTLKQEASGGVEMDIHADTYAFGGNFVRLHDTMQTVSVSPYGNKYEVVHDVPLSLLLPPYNFILVVHQGLWFGESLPNFLLNPNQL